MGLYIFILQYIHIGLKGVYFLHVSVLCIFVSDDNSISFKIIAYLFERQNERRERKKAKDREKASMSGSLPKCHKPKPGTWNSL